jgi:hypothetical protein
MLAEQQAHKNPVESKQSSKNKLSKIAQKRIGIRENPKASNRGDSVTKWSKKYFKYPIPWCAVFASEISQQSKVKFPRIRSAQAIKFVVKNYSVPIKEVFRKNLDIPIGSYLVKSRKGGNHVDILIAYDRKNKIATVVGGNVNDAVTKRKIKLSLTDRYAYTYYTAVK